MKRIFKVLLVAIIGITSVFACALAVGCTGDGGGKTSDYNFTVLTEDGTPVNGKTDGANGGVVLTQICIGTATCIPLYLPDLGRNIYPDENGKLSLSQKQVNEFFGTAITVDGDITEFDFHVLNFPGYNSDCSVAVNGKGDYELKLYK